MRNSKRKDLIAKKRLKLHGRSHSMFVPSNQSMLNEELPQKNIKSDHSDMNLVIQKFDQLTFGLTFQQKFMRGQTDELMELTYLVDIFEANMLTVDKAKNFVRRTEVIMLQKFAKSALNLLLYQDTLTLQSKDTQTSQQSQLVDKLVSAKPLLLMMLINLSYLCSNTSVYLADTCQAFRQLLKVDKFLIQQYPDDIAWFISNLCVDNPTSIHFVYENFDSLV